MKLIWCYLLFFALLFSYLSDAGASSEEMGFVDRVKLHRQEKRDVTAMKIRSDVSSRIDQPGDYVFVIVHDGLKRFYRVHVPKNYQANKPAPLLLVFHGGGGNMHLQASNIRYEQISSSEKHAYVVVFPNGYSKFESGKFATWAAGACCADARDKNIDDVGFVKKIIQNVSQQLNIDKQRIFASGMSNGGMMTYRLACEMSDTFKAIAAVAGTDNTIQCAPHSPIAILHIHAKNDDRVLYMGGAGKKFRDEAKVTAFNSVPATIDKWVRLNGCNSNPQRVLDVAGAYCDRYSACRNDVKVQLCTTEEGGHSWPGVSKMLGQAPSQALSANDVMWDFFSSLTK